MFRKCAALNLVLLEIFSLLCFAVAAMDFTLYALNEHLTGNLLAGILMLLVGCCCILSRRMQSR